MVTAMKNKKVVQNTVATGKRMDLTDLQRKYKKINFVAGSLRFVNSPSSHFHNKQVVDVICKDNNKRRTLATSDLQHYKQGALSEEAARERRLERIRARRRAANASKE